jgi:hypothetical protein
LVECNTDSDQLSSGFHFRSKERDSTKSNAEASRPTSSPNSGFVANHRWIECCNPRRHSHSFSPVPQFQSRPTVSVPSHSFSPVPQFQSRPTGSVPSHGFSPVPRVQSVRQSGLLLFAWQLIAGSLQPAAARRGRTATVTRREKGPHLNPTAGKQIRRDRVSMRT